MMSGNDFPQSEVHGIAPANGLDKAPSGKPLPPVDRSSERYERPATVSITPQATQEVSQHSAQGSIASSSIGTISSSIPSIYKRKLRRKPKGILKPAPPPTKAFSFKRDIIQQLNTRLAQQGVNVQVPVPTGPTTLSSFGETAQGTAQAAGNLLGGMFRKMSGMVGPFPDDLSPPSAARAPRSSPEIDARGREAVLPASSSSTNEETNSTVRTNNLPTPSSSIRPLRRVRFPVYSIGVIYPISNAIAPAEEDATRIRIEEEYRAKLKSKQASSWTVAELETVYRDCCKMREEHPLKKMRSVFLQASQQSEAGLRSMDLSSVPLDRNAIEPIADLLCIDFGLKKLVLEDCGLTDEGLKSILNSLLASGSLPNLSLASNRKIKYHGWRYVGIFMRRAKALQYLDLSENTINKASLEHIAGAIAQSSRSKAAEKGSQAATREDEDERPLTTKCELLEEGIDGATSLSSLRLENCGLRSNSLEILAHSVRFSELNHLSLRRNRISQVGSVALAIMMKDYPDSQGAIVQGINALDRLEEPYVVSSPGGGVTRRSLVRAERQDFAEPGTFGTIPSELDSPSLELDRKLTENEREQIRQLTHDQGRTEQDALALFHAKRAKKILSGIPRVGNLLTLDLKGNEIRGGVAYLSQALRKNRTLKVLNLSDNGIEVDGLVALADALKYNSTLETLDLSHNPCCGPGLGGITTLRNAFTLNSNLKRLFISDTELSSEGAIALAEFLPEARSLIHLDLTENAQIDIAGVMALAVSVRMNKSLRCLDLNIPPNAPDFARLSQEILNSCIRNTEAAQRKAQQRGVKAPIAAPIYKSTLARAAKEKAERNKLVETNKRLEQVHRGEGEASQADRNRDKVVEAAMECDLVLKELLGREKERKKELLKERGTHEEAFQQSELTADLLKQGCVVRDKLHRALGFIVEGERLAKALQVNEDLEAVIAELRALYSSQRIGGKQTVNRSAKGDKTSSDSERLRTPDTLHAGLSSPSFSIGSDEEEEEGGEGSVGLEEQDTDSSAGRVISGIVSAVTEVEQQAAREIPSEGEVSRAGDEENHEAVEKARGQLSEEAEIFRRARSLHVEGGDEDASEKNPDNPQKFKTAGERAPNKFGATAKGSQSDENTGKKGEEEVSGEELRRELLESNVPRHNPTRHVGEEEKEDTIALEAAQSGTT